MVSTSAASIKGIQTALKSKERLLKSIHVLEVRKRLSSPEVVSAYQQATLGRFREIQTGYFGGQVGKEDPTAPLPYAGLIMEEVQRNLYQSAQLFTGAGPLVITVLSDEFLGLNTEGPTSTKDTTPMRWIYYFIRTGFKTDLLWINATTQQKMGPVFSALYKGTKGKRSGASTGYGSMGRFGAGYLLAVPSANKSTVQAAMTEAKLNYDNLLHPQSQQPGNEDLFSNISGEVGLQALVLYPAVIEAKRRFLRFLAK